MNYAPISFSSHDYETLKVLCESIIPADISSGGAIEAGVPEFIDLIASQNRHYQQELISGVAWLDDTCVERYGELFLECSSAQQKKILDLIAFRKNAKHDPRLDAGIQFFAGLRENTVDAFFSSAVGLKYLGVSHQPFERVM
jgi:gluconate 2-dehydrogenase gamma chain